ncbi:Alkaline phosphatase synthesis transcriptional regulatory protein PhoP [Planctomycetales bacterium 10988]|nr:Alkaline phosphatase synthesis transcriptional regulatory protein PhoP [Planctomycetales bacterium 10988]
MSQPKILIIEDEPSLVEVLAYNLEAVGYEVLSAGDGEAGLEAARLHRPDLIVLDIMLPLMDGLEVCRQLRADERTRGIAILILTAKAEEVDEVVGFQMGADDYVIKPFKIGSLTQRIRALLRRTQHSGTDQEILAAHGLELDRWRHRSTLNGEELPLTVTEFRLLWALARQPGRAFTRHELLEAALGDSAVAQERTVDVHIKAIRQKLGRHAGLVETVRGVGYRFPEGPPALDQEETIP